MYSASDFEKLWFLYKTEGGPKGISLNSFCVSHATFNASTALALQPAIGLSIAAQQHLNAAPLLKNVKPFGNLRENLFLYSKIGLSQL